ncbi:MAG: CusA/CzcA family heavy metal efflux RND transporter [Bacteroidota bacterium]|nr:CusA/CzcA family heavy metal efflux RND transporter [Bacteroidota bacterium]
MFTSLIAYSVRNKFVVLLGVIALISSGIWALTTIPMDAVPDITNNQVQVVTTSPSLAAEEVEKFITYPIEISMANVPGVEEIRSISRYGLSVVTVIFEDDMPIMKARQFVGEQLKIANDEIPSGLGSPEMMPITTGLGEVYQYILEVDPEYRNEYDAMELRTIQDWLVKRQLAGIEGIVEVSSFGGFLKQYEVSFDPLILNSYNITVDQVMSALERNNANTGGSYVEKGHRALYIRAEGLLQDLDDIRKIVVDNRGAQPILVGDIAEVGYGFAPRFGAMTIDGLGETVGGITLMLKGENANAVVKRVKDRVDQIQNSLPPGVHIRPYLDRSELVGRTIRTVAKNLVEGGFIVILILVLLLGNFRAGLIVASVIPLAMLFALLMMKIFGVSANLMSLGAIDFGIVVDGAVIIVEGILHVLVAGYLGRQLSQKQMDEIVIQSSARIYTSAAFGVLIILVVFFPILSLSGIEGKMFRPMAQTLMFALGGALLLSLTYVPAVTSMFLSRRIKPEKGWGPKVVDYLRSKYQIWLDRALNNGKTIIAIAVGLLLISVWQFNRMGAVFLPDLEEGDLAMQMSVRPGSNLSESIQTSERVEQILLDNFPEVIHVVSKIGTAEVPTDPMAIEDADVMIVLKPKEEWTSAETREDLVAMMKEKLSAVPSATFEFTQPIQLRFNELITGSKADIAVKIFGEDNEVLYDLGRKAEELIKPIQGAGDVKVERTEGLPQFMIRYRRDRIARYGLSIQELNHLIQTAFAGTSAGIIYEGERRFDLVLRLDKDMRSRPDISQLYITSPIAGRVPLSEVADYEEVDGPMMISREDTRRRITVGVNVRDRDLTSVVEDIRSTLEKDLNLPPGYRITYGGEFENFQSASKRLMVAVPVALGLIMVLLFFAFNSWKYAFLIFSAIPMAAIGGVWVLSLRGMPFSISAGVGFIALFGVAVLNGIVMISHINHLRFDENMDLRKAILRGGADRLRAVLMTALVATFGFIPMAFSSSAGAEVQKPLATVVIGGLITATILTLFVLPAIYFLVEGRKRSRLGQALPIMILLMMIPSIGNAQDQTLSWDSVQARVLRNNPTLQIQELEVDAARARTNGGWQLAPTQFEYQYGDLNMPGIRDNQWMVVQDLGSIPSHIQRQRSLNMAADAAEAGRKVNRRQFMIQLKKSYYNWLFRKQRLDWMNREKQTLDTLGKVVDLRYQQGAITGLEKSMYQGKITQFYKMIADEYAAYLTARSELSSLSQTDLEGQAPDPLDWERPSLPGDSLTIEGLMTPIEMRLESSEASWRSERGQFFPGLSAGYSQMEFEGVQGGGIYMLGVSFPLWFGPASARAKESRLRYEQDRLDLDRRKWDYQNRLRVALERSNTYRQLYADHGTRLSEDALSLRRKAIEAFRLGDSDAFQLIQSLITASELYLNHMDLTHQYYMAQIDLELFTIK